MCHCTLEPRYNEPLYNEVLGMNKRFSSVWPKLQENVSKRAPKFKEILIITNTVQKRKRKIYLHITNKCQHLTKEECKTDQPG